MYSCPHAGNATLPRCIQEIALQFDGGEVLRSIGEILKCPVPAGRIRQGNDSGGMQVPIRGVQSGGWSTVPAHAEKFNADQAGQVSSSAGVELVNGGHQV